MLLAFFTWKTLACFIFLYFVPTIISNWFSSTVSTCLLMNTSQHIGHISLSCFGDFVSLSFSLWHCLAISWPLSTDECEVYLICFSLLFYSFFKRFFSIFFISHLHLFKLWSKSLILSCWSLQPTLSLQYLRTIKSVYILSLTDEMNREASIERLELYHCNYEGASTWMIRWRPLIHLCVTCNKGISFSSPSTVECRAMTTALPWLPRSAKQ